MPRLPSPSVSSTTSCRASRYRKQEIEDEGCTRYLGLREPFARAVVSFVVRGLSSAAISCARQGYTTITCGDHDSFGLSVQATGALAFAAASSAPPGPADPALLHDAPITVLLAVLLALGVPEKHDGCAL
jgi:hypothetical protein